MTKEQKYADELRRLGIYDQAFEPTIHQLAILEREQSRTRKAWKTVTEKAGTDEAGAAMMDKLYAVILQQDKMILTLRETLGLTPRGLKKFKASFGTELPEDEEKPKTVLELLQEKRRTAG